MPCLQDKSRRDECHSVGARTLGVHTQECREIKVSARTGSDGWNDTERSAPNKALSYCPQVLEGTKIETLVPWLCWITTVYLKQRCTTGPKAPKQPHSEWQLNNRLNKGRIRRKIRVNWLSLSSSFYSGSVLLQLARTPKFHCKHNCTLTTARHT